MWTVRLDLYNIYQAILLLPHDNYNLLFSVMRCYWLTLRSAWCEDTRVWQYPNFFSGTGTYFWYQIFPAPVLIIIFGAKFFQCLLRYLFSVPIFSGTSSDTYIWYQIFPEPPQKMENSPVLVSNSRFNPIFKRSKNSSQILFVFDP